MLNGTTIFFWMGIVSKFNGYRIPWRSPHGETLWPLNLTQQKCIWMRGDWNGALRIVWDAGWPERCRPEFIDHYKLKNLFYFGGILSYNPNNFFLITHGFQKITSGFTVMLSFSIPIHFRIPASSLSGTPLTLCGGTRVNTTLLWMENRPHWPECRQCFPLRMGPYIQQVIHLVKLRLHQWPRPVVSRWPQPSRNKPQNKMLLRWDMLKLFIQKENGFWCWFLWGGYQTKCLV